MGINYNSASRISAILEKAVNSPLSKGDRTCNVIDLWKDVFEVRKTSGEDYSIEICKKLILLKNEVSILERALESRSVPKDSYIDQLLEFRKILSPLAFLTSWNPGKIKKWPSNFLLYAQSLTHEEDEISQEDLSSVLDAISNLEKMLDDNDINIELKKYIEKHIKIMKEALDNYPMCGAKIFKEALYTGVGEAISNEVFFKAHKDVKEFVGLKDIWKKVSAFTDGALKIYKLADMMRNVTSWLD